MSETIFIVIAFVVGFSFGSIAACIKSFDEIIKGYLNGCKAAGESEVR